MYSDRTCRHCSREIPSGVHPYTMRIELFPCVEESLQISERELGEDSERKMREIVRALEAMDEEEIRLQEERVYSCFRLVVCPRCRDEIAAGLRRERRDS